MQTKYIDDIQERLANIKRELLVVQKIADEHGVNYYDGKISDVARRAYLEVEDGAGYLPHARRESKGQPPAPCQACKGTGKKVATKSK